MSYPIDHSKLCPVCKEGQMDYYDTTLYSCGTRRTPAGIAASDKCLARQNFKREILQELSKVNPVSFNDPISDFAASRELCRQYKEVADRLADAATSHSYACRKSCGLDDCDCGLEEALAKLSALNETNPTQQ